MMQVMKDVAGIELPESLLKMAADAKPASDSNDAPAKA